MNSPSVRVEWPIVSTVVEGSRLARLFPPRPAGSVLTADGLIFGICLHDTRYHFDSPAEIKSFVPPWRGSGTLCRIAPNRPKLLLATEGCVQ